MSARIIPFPVRNPAEASDPNYRCPTLRELIHSTAQLAELQGFSPIPAAQRGDRGPQGDGDDAA